MKKRDEFLPHTCGINILFADDDRDDCFLFEDALKEISLFTHLTTVHDGEQLMQLLNEKKEHLPDILFLDLNMPRKNGFECLLEIKRTEKLKRLPVLIFSTSFESKAVNLLYKNGAQHFILKPGDFMQLKKIIQQALNIISQIPPGGKAQHLIQPAKENFILV